MTSFQKLAVTICFLVCSVTDVVFTVIEGINESTEERHKESMRSLEMENQKLDRHKNDHFEITAPTVLQDTKHIGWWRRSAKDQRRRLSRRERNEAIL